MFDKDNLEVEGLGMDTAEESVFKDTPVATLLAKAKEAVTAKCKTVEACEEMLIDVQNEADKFTNCFEEMKQAGLALDAGTMTKDEFKARILAIGAQLKEYALCVKLGDTTSERVTDEEITNLRAYIIGLVQLIQARKEELQSKGAEDAGKTTQNQEASESITTMFGEGVMTEDGDYEIAEEGLFTKFTKNGKNAKEEVDAMPDKQVVKLYANYLYEKHGDKLVTDEDDITGGMDDIEMVKIGKVKFGVTEEGYHYAIKKKNGKISRRVATMASMRKIIITEIAEQKKKGANEAANEALVNLFLNTGLASSREVAQEAVLAALTTCIAMEAETDEFDDDLAGYMDDEADDAAYESDLAGYYEDEDDDDGLGNLED